MEGLILGIATWMSFLLSWWHLPRRVKNFFLNHPVFSDMSSSVLAFLLLSGISKSITAVIASITTGLLMNFTIIGYNWSKRNAVH